MKSLLSIVACFALLADQSIAQDDAPAAKAAASAAARALKLKLFLMDVQGRQVPAKSVRLHVSGAHLGGDGGYLTNGAGELKLTLVPGAYTLDVLGPAMCSFALTIKSGQDQELALLVPAKDGGKCPVAQAVTKEPAKEPVAFSASATAP